ncbi:hypothetical protein [Micromonospora sp. 050-3]|uniref:hypothetical protein n=1 Tax=Micromonospora sp. 050-3 TaxID=2789265 RepID=UPI00397BEC79
MTIPVIPKTTLVPNSKISVDDKFGGLRLLRYQSNAEERAIYEAFRYEFQHEMAKRHMIHGAVLALKGASPNYRITAMLHPTLRQFIEIVRYDPAAPPLEDYEALGMRTAHDQTQQDFRGAKKENLHNFKQYNVEAIRGDRTAYLPPVSGWQSSEVFEDTIFVALDESNPMALYGILYLPKKPVMQSDGQTQTAALFQAAAAGVAIKAGALDNFGTTLEIELNVTPLKAGQSFADRNGRGSKKNKNLVALMDNSSALARLRQSAIVDTIFEGRLADGRSVGASETATKNIVDLSTMDQMLLNVISRGSKKPEQIKHYHVEHLLPYCREFLLLLQEEFGPHWLDPTPKDSEPYRRLYVHGWAFALKAIALAYHDCRRDVIAPLATPIGQGARDEHTTSAEAEAAYIKATKEAIAPPVEVGFDELRSRLEKIDWLRYRKHWIEITGNKLDKAGAKKTRVIKDGSPHGKLVVEGKAENTAAAISNVARKILSDHWTELTSEVDATP